MGYLNTAEFGRLELPVPSSVRKNKSEVGFGNEIGFSIFLRIGMEPKLESHFFEELKLDLFLNKKKFIEKKLKTRTGD